MGSHQNQIIKHFTKGSELVHACISLQPNDSVERNKRVRKKVKKILRGHCHGVVLVGESGILYFFFGF